MPETLDLRPITGPAAWRGDVLSQSTEWIHHLSDAERDELEALGRRFVQDDPDLRSVTAADYPFDACVALNEECSRQLDAGRGFILIRGLRTDEYGDEVAGAIFFIMGLHLGLPIAQNQMGDLLDHVGLIQQDDGRRQRAAVPGAGPAALPLGQLRRGCPDVLAGFEVRRRLEPGQRRHHLQRDRATSS